MAVLVVLPTVMLLQSLRLDRYANDSWTALVMAAVLAGGYLVHPSQVNILTGVVLLGFAFGWVMLAVLSVRFNDNPVVGSPTPPSLGRPPSTPPASPGPLGRDDRRLRAGRLD